MEGNNWSSICLLTGNMVVGNILQLSKKFVGPPVVWRNLIHFIKAELFFRFWNCGLLEGFGPRKTEEICGSEARATP
jgi:hypothetical protein